MIIPILLVDIIFSEKKTKEMDRQLNDAYKNDLGYIEWKRDDKIKKYKPKGYCV